MSPAVLLLDEIEKAHKVCSFMVLFFNNTHKAQDVIMILLQILDEGQLTDSAGRKVDFRVGSPQYLVGERLKPSCVEYYYLLDLQSWK